MALPPVIDPNLPVNQAPLVSGAALASAIEDGGNGALDRLALDRKSVV